MPDDTMTNIQRLIDGFVKKNLPVAADRLYLPAELGGIGVFEIKKFFQAQHCSWILRAAKLQIDNWRFDLRVSAPDNNILAIRPGDLDPDTNPILHNFAESYSIFYGEFSKINGNYKEAYIFSNPAFTRGPDTVQTLDQNFFGNNMHNNICTSKFCDCFVGNRLKTVGEFLADGIPLTGANWMRLQAALLSARNRLRKNDDTDNLCETVENFVSKIKKGSKKFRLVLELSSKSLRTRII